MKKKTEDKNLTAAITALNDYTKEHANDNSYDIMQVKGVCNAVAWFLTGVQNGFETGDTMANAIIKDMDLPGAKTSVEEARRLLAMNIRPGKK